MQWELVESWTNTCTLPLIKAHYDLPIISLDNPKYRYHYYYYWTCGSRSGKPVISSGTDTVRNSTNYRTEEPFFHKMLYHIHVTYPWRRRSGGRAERKKAFLKGINLIPYLLSGRKPNYIVFVRPSLSFPLSRSRFPYSKFRVGHDRRW